VKPSAVEPLVCFGVLDAVGLAKLERRSPDLDGGVPLRVAQACAPLLEGNAFGHQIVLQKRIEIRRSFTGTTADVAEPHRAAAHAAHRAAVTRLVAQGFLAREGAWHRLLARGPVVVERPRSRSPRVLLWTGLLARPDEGTWLRVSGTANRRNLFVEIEETVIGEPDALVPIVLAIRPRAGAPDRVVLEGEVGTLAPLSPRVAFEERALADAPEVGRAHAAFYDAAYFAAKKREPTRKYRRTFGRAGDAPDGHEEGRSEVIVAGPASHAIVAPPRFAGAAGPEIAPPRAGSLMSVTFTNLVGFQARFDGLTLAIEPDRKALADGARAVERTWTGALGDGFVEKNRGAILYLTKYFTPHPAGEAHLFVKPWSFVRTPPGWSSLLEGAHGDGWDVMRGVVATDGFFATPAVFRVHRLGEPIVVEAGEPLLTVTPVPRRLLDAGYREVRWRDA
jgi:hypothetical protein